jgi:hypothetical protein
MPNPSASNSDSDSRSESSSSNDKKERLEFEVEQKPYPKIILSEGSNTYGDHSDMNGANEQESEIVPEIGLFEQQQKATASTNWMGKPQKYS